MAKLLRKEIEVAFRLVFEGGPDLSIQVAPLERAIRRLVDEVGDRTKAMCGRIEEQTPRSLVPPFPMESLKRSRAATDIASVEAALREHHGNRTRAAHQLRIARTTLHDLMLRYGLLERWPIQHGRPHHSLDDQWGGDTVQPPVLTSAR